MTAIFDGHNDTLTRLYPHTDTFFERGTDGHLDLPRAREGGLTGGIFAIFTPPPEDSPERDPMHGLTFTEDGYEVTPHSPLDYEYAKAYTNAILDYLNALEVRGAGDIGIVRSYQDLEDNLQRDAVSIVLAFEGAEAISEDLSDLESYYAQRLRVLGLVWSRPNRFATGAPFAFPRSPDIGPGLTDAGKKLVRECNRLGILIDLAHINAKGFWDAAETTDAPLVVSHAGVYALCPSTRNLTDAQLDAIGQSNGLVGIMFEPLNTRSDGRQGADTPLAEIVRHITYVAERIGVEHVAFGSDFDGAEIPDAIGDVSGLPRLLDALLATGYDKVEIEQIAWRNWWRVLGASWK